MDGSKHSNRARGASRQGCSGQSEGSDGLRYVGPEWDRILLCFVPRCTSSTYHPDYLMCFQHWAEYARLRIGIGDENDLVYPMPEPWTRRLTG